MTVAVSGSLSIYNTASRCVEPVKPANDGFGMYCCGPTVYNYAHIGNLRTYIFEDVLRRTLQSLGHKVKHVVNITDVGHLTSDEDAGDDKMEKGALREGKTVWDIAAFYTARFMENIRDLNILEPHVWPKATEHIPEMISIVEQLEKKGYTYQTSDGIYFDTSKFDRYCEFARLKPESLQAGSRVEMGDKRSVTDFALWKFSPADKKRQMEWDSPWGKGFPGWHIECSAMSLKYLTQPVDIHCGGTDHVRVHHTNEIAQTEAATGKQFVRYWMHGEFLTMAESKMAKSGGNFITLDSLKEKGIDPLAYRMFCYTAHYRSPLAFSWDGLAGSAQSLKNLRKLVLSETGAVKNTEHVSQESVISALKSFSTAVCEDLNMPRAIASLWELARNSDIPSEVRRAALASADEICALDIFKPAIETGVSTDESGTIRVVSFGGAAVDVQAVFNKIHDRREARKLKDFKKADVIRDELIALGIAIKDLPSGITECTVTSADS